MGVWQVYIVLCRDGTLYTGITTDVTRRVSEHNSSTGGARYTKSRQPVRLVYVEEAGSRAMAARREWRIKRMAAGDKWSLISTDATE